jgi:hypothetical protein
MRSLSEDKTYRALNVSKASRAYEPILIRLLKNALTSAGLTMSMKEEEATDEVRI